MERVMEQEREDLIEEVATKDFVRAEIAATQVEVAVMETRLTDKMSVMETRLLKEIAAARVESGVMEARLLKEIAAARVESGVMETRLTDKMSAMETRLFKEIAAARVESVAMEARLMEKILGTQRWMIGIGITIIGLWVSILLALLAQGFL